MTKTGAKEFGKAQVSSAFSTAVDFLGTAVVYELTEHVVLSTAIGAVMGGVANCTTNYRWTFKGTTRSKRGVAWRYMLVWIGSIVLNTSGTESGVKSLLAVYESFDIVIHPTLAHVLGVKAFVAAIVAVFWNFLMQKYYVYRK